MMTKYDANKVNSDIADTVHKYIADGYRIDCKDSIITDDDKGCTFKAVLTKDVDGIECKVKVTLSETGDESNKTYTYHKVDTVGDTRWSEETRSYSSSTDKTELNTQNFDKAQKMWEADINDWRKQARYFSDAYNLGLDWLGKASVVDDVYNLLNSMSLDSLCSVRDALLNMDDKKTSADDKSNADKKDPTKYTCKCPSAFNRLDDVIKVPKKDDNADAKTDADKKPDYKYGVWGLKDRVDDWFNTKHDRNLLSLISDLDRSFNALHGDRNFDDLMDLWRDYRFLDKACDEWLDKTDKEKKAGKEPTYNSLYDYVKAKTKADDKADCTAADKVDDKKIDEIVDKVHTDKKETKSDKPSYTRYEDPMIDRMVNLIRSLL